MAEHDLSGKKVAILITHGVEQDELTGPREALEEAGATTQIVSPESDRVKGWNHTDWGEEFEVDIAIERADAANFDALLLPGGVMNPDRLRMNKKAVDFVRDFFEQGKPVASICHGPWVLVEAGVVKGLTMTSYRSIKTDIRNAGAEWVDQEVVTDQGVVTSRSPDDLPAFNRKMIEEIAEGAHEERRLAA